MWQEQPGESGRHPGALLVIEFGCERRGEWGADRTKIGDGLHVRNAIVDVVPAERYHGLAEYRASKPPVPVIVRTTSHCLTTSRPSS